jgi:hypothetical protein
MTVRQAGIVTIANNQSLSGPINLEGATLVAIEMPAAWDAANLTFQASSDGVTYNDLYDDSGTEVVVTAAASRFIIFRADKEIVGARHLKVRSGPVGGPINQTAERKIRLYVS